MVETMIRIKELKDKISEIDEQIMTLQKEMEEAMKPYKERIEKLKREKDEMQNELNKLEHSIEYLKFIKIVKRKDKMTLKELILKGDGTFEDYQYFLSSGTEVKPSIFLQIKKEFKNLEEFKRYIESIVGKVNYIDYGLSGVHGKYTEGRIDCYKNTPIETVRKLYLKGFIIGWNGEIFVRCLNRGVRYVRNIDKIIVVRKEVKK